MTSLEIIPNLRYSRWWQGQLSKMGTFFITISPALRTEPKSQSFTREKSDLKQTYLTYHIISYWHIITSSYFTLSSSLLSNFHFSFWKVLLGNKKTEMEKGPNLGKWNQCSDEKEEKMQLWRHWHSVVTSSPHPHPPTPKLLSSSSSPKPKKSSSSSGFQ